MKTLIVFACCFGVAFGAPVPKEVKKGDAARFVGEWWECQFEATQHPDADKARRFTFDKDGALAIRQTAGAVPEPYRVVLDQTTLPPSFALSNKTGLIFNAVYHLDGDSLRFVLTAVGKPIAKEAKHGDGGAYYELKRVK